ncbi:MAG: serine/threonine protein kinase, partial [Myxococcales bacterium]|nr:serine/threonine protein kinase [Myxococcales bacterium]
KVHAGATDARGLELLRVEARAMAQLAHPHVVEVFEVGMHQERLFIAMELVDGGTLRTWQQDRPWREVVGAYLAAGEGLAAAHHAGLVHRDFKPENVLVGADDRPRVADFGLVLGLGRRSLETLEDPTSDVDAQLPSRGSGITRAGVATRAVAGTPRYMAPEQKAGLGADHRADQYAFAASLWEALHGWRPGVGGTRALADGVDEREASSGEGPARAADASEPAGVPRHVVAALRCALAEDPSDRWPGLDALLAELRRDPAARRRSVARGVGALGLAAAVAGAVLATRPDDAPCDDGMTKIEPVWNQARRRELAAVVADGAWPAIEQRVHARAEAWVDAYGRACRATQLRAADDDVLHRRMLCLSARRNELDALLGALASGSRSVVGHAAEAVDLLPASERCLEPNAGGTEVSLPDDPTQRVEIAKAQQQVAELEAAVLDPTTLDPAGKAERVVTMARATGWAPVLAQALIARGVLEYEQDRVASSAADYEEAIHLALAAGSDELALHAMMGAAWSMADLRRIPEATLMLSNARALWERMGRASYEERLLLGAECHVALQDDRPHDALALTRAQIAVTEREGEVPITLEATNQYNLGIALEDTGELAEAFEAASKAVALAREALGDDHPTVARYQGLAALVASQRRDYDTAVSLATHALEIGERWYGPDHISLTIPLDVLGETARHQGRPDDALAYWRRHLELYRRHDPESPEIPKRVINLAILAAEGRDFASAEPLAAQGLAGLERRLGPNAPQLVQALVVTGYIARERPEPDLVASERDLSRAVALATAGLGADHTETINAELELANTEVAAGTPERAVARLERRLAQSQGLELPALQPSQLREALAKALAATGATQRACALATEAEDGLRELHADAASVTEWLGQHCTGATRDPTSG